MRFDIVIIWFAIIADALDKDSKGHEVNAGMVVPGDNAVHGPGSSQAQIRSANQKLGNAVWAHGSANQQLGDAVRSGGKHTHSRHNQYGSAHIRRALSRVHASIRNPDVEAAKADKNADPACVSAAVTEGLDINIRKGGDCDDLYENNPKNKKLLEGIADACNGEDDHKDKKRLEANMNLPIGMGIGSAQVEDISRSVGDVITASKQGAGAGIVAGLGASLGFFMKNGGMEVATGQKATPYLSVRDGLKFMLRCEAEAKKAVPPHRPVVTAVQHVQVQPMPQPQPAETSVCFAGQSLVQTWGGVQKTMASLRAGDLVRTPAGYDRVHGFLHQSRRKIDGFLEVIHEEGRLRISPSHLLFLPHGEAVPASSLKAGRTIVGVNGTIKVLEVHQNVSADGFYAPFTDGGILVVDGVVASVYASPGPSEGFSLVQQLFHISTVPMRWLLFWRPASEPQPSLAAVSASLRVSN